MDTNTNNEPIAEEEVQAENPQPDSTSSPQAEEPLAKAERERDEYLGGWQRAKADFMNYKKDELKRLEEMARYQTEGIVKEFIGVMDNFNHAITAMEKQGGMDKGISMIKTQIEDILKKRGLTRIPISPGDPFDPRVAEAIAEVESTIESGNVVEEIEAGYMMQDKVIRPARVKVAK